MNIIIIIAKIILLLIMRKIILSVINEARKNDINIPGSDKATTEYA